MDQASTPATQLPCPFASRAPIRKLPRSVSRPDFDQSCLAFDEADEDENGVPDAISFDMSPQFFSSVSYSGEDTDGEIDIIIADYSPPLATLSDSERLISVRFTAVCQPADAAGAFVWIDFSSEPPVSLSGPTGQPVDGNAIGDSVLILPQPDYTPVPTPPPQPLRRPTRRQFQARHRPLCLFLATVRQTWETIRQRQTRIHP